MAYSKEVLHRAEARLEQARRQNELDCERRISAIYEKLPRLAEIDRELRKTSAKVYAAAFRESESPEQAMQTLKQENLSLQRERDWILESENIDPEDLERKLCGGSGWRGAAMCECLRELCRQEQKKALMQAFGAGKESFEKFRLDVYPERIDPKLGISPRALMKRVYESAVSYTKTFSEGSDSLLFMGATGLGKTFLSGCIARAVACKPEIILFDEAISSLDAHTQVQVMDLLRELKNRLGLTYIFITHDLTSITYLCDDVLFLYQGRVTEHLPVERISETKDEYARKLLESIVVFDTEESA